MAVIEREATTTHAGRLSRFTTAPLWLMGVAAIAVNGLLFGVGPVPYFGVLDPWRPVESGTEHSSPLAWIVLDAVGVGNATAAWLAHLLWLVAMVVGAAYLFRRWISDWAARLFLVAWFASPVANTQVSWLGKPDPGTMFGAVLVGIAPAGWCLAGGMLLGFNHSEQGLFIVAATTVLWFVDDRPDRDRRRPLYAAGGLVLGRALWGVYAIVAEVEANTRAQYIADVGFDRYVRMWRGDMPTLVFAALGVVWVPVLYMLTRQPTRQRVGLAVAFLVALPAAMLTLDTTRVLGLLTLPILVWTVRWCAENVRPAEVSRVLPWFLLAAVFVPRPQIWVGPMVVSSWERFL